MTENYDYIQHLKGLTLWRSTWTRPRAEWDHDHCAVCWAKFSDIDAPEILREGFTTGTDYAHGARYEWVCDPCFSKLRDEMGWSTAHGQKGPPRNPKGASRG
jgi:hypothetical protein